MDIILRPWRHYADFSGRSSRSEFWLFFIVFYVVLIAVFLIPLFALGLSVGDELAADGDNLPLLVMAPAGLLFLAGLIPSIAVTVRRLHDSDKSGWLYLLTILPYIGFLFFIVFGFLPGTKGENSYGFNPRDGDQMPDEAVNQIFG